MKATTKAQLAKWGNRIAVPIPESVVGTTRQQTERGDRRGFGASVLRRAAAGKVTLESSFWKQIQKAFPQVDDAFDPVVSAWGMPRARSGRSR